ncbi:jg17816 [Pararge aegeria aegeria]|uniref:Jg17816 protein n=1 Tax=Pararge aegeria aegeria TaxID=348720 RepID=A0A8S4SKH4_9NEOP|nr:jg17816 [Pararge aegeria aegeria]
MAITCDCPMAQPGPTLAATCGGGAFMLFMGLLEVFLRSQCDLEDPCGRAQLSLRRESSLLPEVGQKLAGEDEDKLLKAMATSSAHGHVVLEV